MISKAQISATAAAILLLFGLTTGELVNDHDSNRIERQLVGLAKDCDITCPKKSKSKRFCPTSLDECECVKGFRKEADLCVCDSECPANSKKKPTVDCPRNTLRHCKCDRGFQFIGKECKCVSKSCASAISCDGPDAYQCPDFSVPESLTECPSSFAECVCVPGYRKNRMRTKCKCNSECPANSKKQKGVDCPTNIERDCMCDDGYKFDNKKGRCIADCEFECPAYSSSKLACPSDATDCECNRGFVKGEGDACVCDKQCPAGSVPRKNVNCPRNLDRHCICDHGFTRVDGKCEPDCIEEFTCPANSKPVDSQAPACNFFQCECDEGYVKKNNECVPCASESGANRTFLPDGVYLLKSHRDGGLRDPTYGLRLDGLLTGTFGDHYTFNFDFQRFDAAVEMKLTVHRDTVTISGTAWGGRDIGAVYDPNLSGLFEIEYSYVGVSEEDGPALELKKASGGSGSGMIKQLFGDGRSFELIDWTAHNNDFLFRLGFGHRVGADTEAISGYGWLVHQPIGGGPGGTFDKRIAASDWLFEIDSAMELFNQC